jgi:uncharacterized protein YndB with AHSA1/START domain
MHDAEPIVREVFIDAPADEVFPYLTDSALYLRWMGVEAELDARPGGIFRVDPNGRDVILGTFVEVDPPRRLVLTWGWDQPGHPMPPGSTRVEIDLTPSGGGTMLRLRHFGVAPGLREPHDGGWQHYLDRLAKAARGADPGPDPFAVPEHRHG